MPERIIKKVLEILKLAKEISRFELFTREEQEKLPFVLAGESDDGPSPEIKLKIYQIILRLRKRIKKPFGFLIVLGWRGEWNREYASTPDITQDIFRDHRFDLSRHSLGECLATIEKTIDFDGAILVNKEGTIISSGVYLENLSPKEVAKEMRPGHKVEDLSEAFGFAKKVHTRHLAAIAASYKLKGTTMFVLSEEDRSVRIFEKGKIIWSTIPSETRDILKQ